MLLEVGTLGCNHGRCPLADVSARFIEDRAPNFDIYLPRVLAQWNKALFGALRFLLFTGWRKSEALSLRWSDLDRERGIATLADTKTGRSNRHLSSHASQVLESMRAYRRWATPMSSPVPPREGPTPISRGSGT